jgi:ribosomal protein S18 acetylase RimI-like enzyme
VRLAHADAWDAHGRHRESSGGGATRLPGVRLMASGLPHAQWNNGDVTDPNLVDVEAVRAWYAGRDTPWGRGVPWGLRVPTGVRWDHGRLLFTKRLMGLLPDQFSPFATPPDVTLRIAEPADADAVLAVDCVAFEAPDEVERPWVEPLLSQPSTTVCLVEMDGRPVGAGHCLVTDGDAGPAVYVAGIGVVPEARRRGIASAMSSWLIERGFDAGAQLAHLHPDTDEAAAVYVGLGFEELPGLDIYVDVA